MKKTTSLFGIVLVVIIFASYITPDVSRAIDMPDKILISGGTAGGAWGAVTEGVAEALRQGLGEITVSTTPGTDTTNFMRLERGKCDLALGVASSGLRAIAGKEPFKEKATNIRAVAALFQEPFQFVILKKTGITDFSQIKAQKFPLRHSPNKKGNFMEILSEAVFEKYGFDYKTIEDWGGKIIYNSYSESINLIRSGSLDSLSGCSPVPTTTFQELSGTHEITILPLKEEVIDSLGKEFGTQKVVIHSSDYNFLTEDVPTVASWNVLVCRADLPDDLVYNVVKTLVQKSEFLSGIHVVLKKLTPEIMANTAGVPLHPGAEKYYREIGVIK